MARVESKDVNSFKQNMLKNISKIYPGQSTTSKIIWSRYTEYVCYNQRARGTYGSSFLYCAFPSNDPSETEIEMLELSYIQVYEVESWIQNIESLVARNSIAQFVHLMAKIAESSILSRGVFNHTFQVKGLESIIKLPEVLVILSKPIARTELCWVLIDHVFNAKRVVIIEYVSLSYERTFTEAAYRYLKWTIHGEQISVQSIAYEIQEERVFNHGDDEVAASDAVSIPVDENYEKKDENVAYNANMEDRKRDILLQLGLSRLDPHIPTMKPIEYPKQSQLRQLTMVDDRLKIILSP